MKAGSKRGAALAIVIIVSAAILILSAALISAAAYNISSTQNGQEGRQAYLDAKSAIEYGKAYVSKNPGCGDFTVLADSMSGSGYKTGAGASDSLAAYTSADKTIRAKAKYKSSDRIRSLTYKFPTKGTDDSLNTLFLLCVAGYGDHKVVDDVWSPKLNDDKKSDYPVIIKKPMQLPSGWGTTKKLTAPMVFLMGKDTTLTCYESYGEIQSDFIYIAGNTITGQDYRGYTAEQKQYSKLLLETNHQSRGVICFGSDCQISVDGWKVTGEESGEREITVKKGYYYFDDDTDLFGFIDHGTLPFKSVAVADLPDYADDRMVQYVNNNFGILCDGDSVWNGDSAIWTNQGRLCDGVPSNYTGGSGQNMKNKIVYLYVTSCDGWEKTLSRDGQSKFGSYIAKEINMQYVNSSEDFTIPANNTVAFMADSILLNTQISDTEVGDGKKPKIVNEGNSSFLLKSTSGSEDFYLKLPYDLKICLSDTDSYTISAGVYHINTGIGVSGKGVSLFTDKAKAYFYNRKPDSPYQSWGGGGSGSTTETGGYYSYD